MTDSLTVAARTVAAQALPADTLTADKFWMVERLDETLVKAHVPFSGFITFLAVVAALYVILYLLNLLGNRVILAVVNQLAKKTKAQFDDFMVQRGSFKRAFELLLAIITKSLTETFFAGFTQGYLKFMNVVLACVIALCFTRLATSIVNVVSDAYNLKPQSREKSIKGYIQLTKIMLYILLGLTMITIIFGIKPTTMLAGLATSALVVSLVFKDTILGFVASIQLSAQDMVRPGDWIEIPSKGVDGNVIDISINTVKVQNWNKTIAMIPIYSLVSEPFTNWRGMQQGEGRRFRRPFLIDIHSVRFIERGDIDRFGRNGHVAPLFDDMVRIFDQSNESGTLTNLGVFRAYIEAFLFRNKTVNNTQPLSVRYLPQDENGVTIELYGFSYEKDFIPFERAVGDIVEHIIAISGVFGIRIYQRTSDQGGKLSGN